MKHFIFLCLTLLSLLLTPLVSSALDIVEEPGKKWETSISVGYMNFKGSNIEDSAFVGLRVQKRVAYPILIGVGVEGSIIGDVTYVELNIPVSARVGVGPLKIDFIVRPGAAYAENTNYDIKKIVGVGTGGIEIKHFIKDGVSLGLGAYYSVLTYSKLNNFKLAVVLGF